MFHLFFIPVKDIIFHILSREGSVQSHPARWFSSKLLYHRLKGSKRFLWVLRSLPQCIALFQLVWFEQRPVDSPPSSILGQISGDSLSGGSKKQIPSRISTPTWSQGGSPLLQNLLNTSCALGIGEGGKLKVGSAIISPAERLGSASRQPGSQAAQLTSLLYNRCPLPGAYVIFIFSHLLLGGSPRDLKVLLAVCNYLVASQWAGSHQVPCQNHREREERFSLAKTLKSRKRKPQPQTASGAWLL